MSIFSIFKRKKWEKLGQSITSVCLSAEFKRYNPSGCFLRDRDYRAIPIEDFMELVADYRLKDPRYAEQIFDCDDYAICFIADLRRAWAGVSHGEEALAFGYVEGLNSIGNAHAWIWHRGDKGG